MSLSPPSLSAVWPGLPSPSACPPVSPPWTTTPRRSWWLDPDVAPPSTRAALTFQDLCHHLPGTTPRQTPPSPPSASLLPRRSPTCLHTTTLRQVSLLRPPGGSRPPSLLPRSVTLTLSHLLPLLHLLTPLSTVCLSPPHLRHPHHPSPPCSTRGTVVDQTRTAVRSESQRQQRDIIN